MFKLRTAYSGNCIRVRRSSDNTEQDFGFDGNGYLDTTSLSNFVGGQNLYTWSEDLSGTNWNGNGINRTSNNGVAPDGITPANLLTEQSTLNNHNLSYSVGLSITAGKAVNNSVYLKKGPGSNAPDIISLYVGNATFNMRAVFNISTGQVLNTTTGSATGFQALITDAGNGWWRCSIGGTLPHTTTQNMVLLTEFCNNVNSTSRQFYLGNVNSNVYVWGLQYSNTNSVQPYNKTTNFVAGDGFVVRWYDQSTNVRNLTQTTAANQPQIVSSGSLITRNGKAVISATSSQWLSLATFINGTAARSWWFTYEKDTTGNQQILGLSGINYMYLDYGTNQYVGNSDFVTISPVLSTNTFRLMNCVYTTATYKMFANGGQIGTNTGGTTTGAIQHVPYNNFRTSTVFFNEFIYWATDQTSNRTSIESNINTRNTIY
jgi:hypothetical protein